MGGEHCCRECGALVGVRHASGCSRDRGLVGEADVLHDPVPSRSTFEVAGDQVHGALLADPRSQAALAVAMSAQAASTLALVEELRGIREDLGKLVGDPDGGGTIRDQVGWALDQITNAVRDMAHNVSDEAMRHRPGYRG